MQRLSIESRNTICFDARSPIPQKDPGPHLLRFGTTGAPRLHEKCRTHRIQKEVHFRDCSKPNVHLEMSPPCPAGPLDSGRADSLEQGLLDNVEEKNPMKEAPASCGCSGWWKIGLMN